MSLAGAHNWINSPRSRATRASTVQPCRQRTELDAPHVKLSLERFHVEWTNGHGRSTHYFALLRAEDEPLLGALTEADLEQYLAEAPEGATRYEGAAWRKRHYGWTDRQAAGGAGSHDEFTAEGKVAIAAGDADHVERPAAFACSHMGQRKRRSDDGSCAPADDLQLYRYPEEAHALDVRVAYASASYPHLLSVHRFKQTDACKPRHNPPAAASRGRVRVHANGAAQGHSNLTSRRSKCRTAPRPASTSLHYVWRGYRDCIDVDLLPAALGLPDTSDAKYGYEVLDPEQISWSRTDHCQYEEHEPYVGSRTDCFPNSGGTCFVIPPRRDQRPRRDGGGGARRVSGAVQPQQEPLQGGGGRAGGEARGGRLPGRRDARAVGARQLRRRRASRASMRARRCATGCAAPRPRMWRRSGRWIATRRTRSSTQRATGATRARVRGPACGEECYGAARCGAAAAVALRGALRELRYAAANALPSAVPHWSLATDCEVCHRDDVGARSPSHRRRRPP